ncbi:MAG TPA: hypothetical protein DEQ09_10840 [Bacteroidales bacterium]|nr:hypothetical protein [Bacteroidales bacterium]
MKINLRYLVLLLTVVLCFNQGIKPSPLFPESNNDSLLITSKLNSFKRALQESSPDASDYYNWILDYLSSGNVSDSIILSDCYYYTGTYKYIGTSFDEAKALLQKSIIYRNAADSIDDIYAKARTNLGLSFLYTGELEKAIENLEMALITRERLFGSDSTILIKTFLNLSAAYVEMNMHERSLTASQKGIKLAEKYPDNVDLKNLIKLYYNSGVSYLRILDFGRAKRNFEMAYSLVENNVVLDLDKLLLLYNSIAVCNDKLGDSVLSDYYFQKALNLIDSTGISGQSVNIVYDNYAFILADKGNYELARDYLLLSVEEVEKEYGKESRNKIRQLLSYSYFLMYYMDNYTEAENILKDIMSYIDKNQSDIHVKYETYLYMSRIMYNKGRNTQALYYINDIIDDSLYVPSNIRTELYIQKSKILKRISGSDNTIQTLEDALSAIEHALSIIEFSRLRINEDESRRMVSGTYYEIFDMAMDILCNLFSLTGDITYHEKAFAISEKSKAAGLLVATRNNRAMNFHLPENLANLEKDLLADIRDYNEVIYTESVKQKPDNDIINRYRHLSVSAGLRYDSLVKVFEKDYPRYYNLRHNTAVSNLNDIRRSIGNDGNFIEYFISDSLLYIFLINKNNFVVRVEQTGVDFKKMILEYRDIITNPSITEDARVQYNKFINLASDLYNRLIKPVSDYLVSDRLIISPDDILSYLPFETLISDKPGYREINYRELDYLLKEYEIIYEYSGTILSEIRSTRRSISNKVLSFAPEYNSNIDINDLIMSRQVHRDNLTNIPGAREEAIYINKLLGGELYIDDKATESIFKRRISAGDIIHLAMHAFLNDRNPMYSKMIFSMDSDTIEDGMLNTYEVYNIPIRSKMLFLSSCNTGIGYLQSGEGVMSLARGFFYSGCPSVIMSLWEVDDRSESDLVKEFYLNLKKGLTKSKSLRKARIEYLAGADQMRSHPYFWSALVILGNDEAVYLPFKRYLLLGFFVVILFLVAGYYRRSESL